MAEIYTPDALTEVSPGHFALRGDYDHKLHRLQVTILGDDSRTAKVHDMQGKLLASGRIYSDDHYQITAPQGTTIRLDVLEIGGALIGYAPSAPLEEGVNYALTGSGDMQTYLQAVFEGPAHTACSGLASGPCFAAGTSVLTDAGPTPVDWLRPGDRLLTRDRGFQPLLRIGRLEPDPARPPPRHQRPVIIAPGALGPGLPATELRVSAQNRLLIQAPQLQLCFGQDAMFCAADYLTGWPGVRQAQGEPPVIYYDLLLPQHEAVLADGTWAESLFLGDLAPTEEAGPLRRHPDLIPDGHRQTAYPCLKRWEAGLLQPPASALSEMSDQSHRLRAQAGM